MPETPEVLVIGAGAAGLMCAITAARLGARVLLLEGQPKPGAKILASGGSRCNLTHDEVLADDYGGGSRKVVARLLRELGAREARRFFEDLGVPTKLESTGKVFPVSDSAVTVRDALLGEAARAGVTLRCGARVAAVERAAGGDPGARAVLPGPRAAGGADPAGPFAVRLESGETLRAGRVVIATGGLSYPATGSRGDGFAWAAALGHSVVPTVPALVPLTTNDSAAHALSGLTLDARLTLRRGEGGRELARAAGSFLFTHFGCSGPAPLDLSRHFLRARAEGAAWVEASWLPGRTFEQVDEVLQAARERDARQSVETVLATLLPRRLAETVAARAGLERGAADGTAGVGAVRRETRHLLARLVTAWPLGVTGTLGYEKAEATAGGVDLSEVNPSTMESRKAPGLFLCGEVLDVDGRLGGFNFQWAWSSGFVAGRGAASP